jgi:outer membrane protein with beta-barrel domain
MKNLLLSGLLIICCVMLNAQVQFGLKGGLNFADIRGDFSNGYDSRIGFNAGAFVELPVTGKFSLKPEVVYSLQGADLSNNIVDGKLSLHYINVPVLVKYNFVKGLFAETGPQIGFLTSSKFKERPSGSTNRNPNLRKTDFSWSFGLGYELPMGLGINGRYNLGVNTTAPHKNVDQKNSVVQIGLFYKIGKR